jgi:uncharacterized membrane protein YwaF
MKSVVRWTVIVGWTLVTAALTLFCVEAIVALLEGELTTDLVARASVFLIIAFTVACYAFVYLLVRRRPRARGLGLVLSVLAAVLLASLLVALLRFFDANFALITLAFAVPCALGLALAILTLLLVTRQRL